MRLPKLRSQLQQTLHNVFLGPQASFRNDHRTWLYFSFIMLMILTILVLGRIHR